MKHIILPALALAMSMSLFGCGGNSPEGVANEFLEAFTQKKGIIDAAKAHCRGQALEKINKYVEQAKEEKKDHDAAWLDVWTNSKDVEKVTDLKLVAVQMLHETSTFAELGFEYKLHRPKEKEEKNKVTTRFGRISVSSVGGTWKVVSFNF